MVLFHSFHVHLKIPSRVVGTSSQVLSSRQITVKVKYVEVNFLCTQQRESETYLATDRHPVPCIVDGQRSYRMFGYAETIVDITLL